MRNNELKIYAIASAHFILASMPEWLEKINSIILFGSVAQGRASKDSDVDLFFDVKLSKKQQIKLRSAIRKAISEFRLSQEALRFKVRGVSNEISFFVGELEEWRDLQKSILSTGIVLYAKYKTRVSKKGLKPCLLIFWEGAGKNRGAFLNKIYGYKVKRKRYSGILERCNGTKIGKSAAVIPAEHKDLFFRIMEDYKINYNVIEIYL